MKCVCFIAISLLATWLVLCSTMCEAATITNCTTEKTPCTCKDTAVGVAIDLKEVADKLEAMNITAAKENHLEYHVSLCGPSKYCEDHGLKGAAVCQHDLYQSQLHLLGMSSQFSFDVESKTSFSIFYQGGESDGNLPRQARFAFTVSSSVTDPQVEDVSEDQGNIFPGFHTYTFNITISPSEEDDAGNTGTVVGIIGLVIIILLIVGIIAYFVIGSVIMYKVKGARGAEMIPNYSFWKELPLLIKDGVMFTFSPCCKKCGKGSGYQSL